MLRYVDTRDRGVFAHAIGVGLDATFGDLANRVREFRDALRVARAGCHHGDAELAGDDDEEASAEQTEETMCEVRRMTDATD